MLTVLLLGLVHPQGDSGAGLYDQNNHKLWGVVSQGTCGQLSASLVVDITNPKVYDFVEPFTRCTSC